MPSLKEVRNQLMFSHFNNEITDEEFLLLYDLNTSTNLDLPYHSYDHFDLDVLENDECLSEFRFRKQDMTLLAEVMQVPDVITCYQRSVCSGLEALCIVLKRLAYPCRYADMLPRFARPVPVLCMINNHKVDLIYQVHGHRILQWNNALLNSQALQEYATAISAQGSPLFNCFGFIDGTVRPISKPGQNQNIVYNGHKRVSLLAEVSDSKKRERPLPAPDEFSVAHALAFPGTSDILATCNTNLVPRAFVALVQRNGQRTLWNNPNLVPRVLWLFGQRMGASRDSGVLEFCYRKISAVKQWKSLQGSQSKN